MEELMKKSIFVQRESFEYIQFVMGCLAVGVNVKGESIMAHSYDSHDSISTNIDNANIIKEIDIPMPLLNKKDSFYFEDEKKIVTIQDTIRTDKDNVVYVIEDKVTYEPKSLEQYEIDKQKYLDIEKLKKELEKLKNAIRTKDKKKIKELIKD